jgi:concanavalin A-like lectin/glucanase superfamily protein
MFIVQGTNNTVYSTDRGTYTGKSLLFDGSDDYLSWTPSSTGNRKTWTLSLWCKRSDLDAGTTGQSLFAVKTDNSNRSWVGFDASDRFYFQDAVSGSYKHHISNAVYRDTHKWYHLVLAYDSTQATASDRVKVWIDDEQITSWNTEENHAQNTDGPFNDNSEHAFGRRMTDVDNRDYFDGYITNAYFIDDQTLTPNDFGYTSTDTGKWVPKKYTGDYGLNGFHHDYSDTTETDTVFDQSSLITGATSRGTYTGDGCVFDSASSQYLSRTFSTPTNNKRFIISAWVKFHETDTNYPTIMYQYTGVSSAGGLYIESSNRKLHFYDVQNGTDYSVIAKNPTNPSSEWQHILLTFDSTVTSPDSVRAIIYINGVQVSQENSTHGAFPLNHIPLVNSAVTHHIGRHQGAGKYSNESLTEYHFIDGFSIQNGDHTIDDFGETLSNIWRPKIVTGVTYGTNGFNLTFDIDDNDTTTVTDNSSNSNTWTANGYSSNVEANGYVSDKPTDNYCVLNPNDNGGLTLSKGNIEFTYSPASWKSCRSTTYIPPSGKYYFEMEFVSGASCALGVANSLHSLASHPGSDVNGWAFHKDGTKHNSSSSAYGTAWSNSDRLQVAVDRDSNAIWFGINNIWQNSTTVTEIQNGITTNAAYTNLDSTGYLTPLFGCANSSIGQAKFSSNDWLYSAPTGFVGLSEANLEGIQYSLSPNIWKANGYSSNVGGNYTNDTMMENYATLNSLDRALVGTQTLSLGNLKIANGGGGSYTGCTQTIPIANTKGYMELTMTSDDVRFGLIEEKEVLNGNSTYTVTGHFFFDQYGNIRNGSGTKTASYTTNPTVGQTLGLAWDFTGGNKNVWWHVQGIWGNNGSGVGVPNQGLYPGLTSSDLTLDKYKIYVAFGGSANGTANFGATTFSYPIGAANDTDGFAPLSSTNLPEPTIKKPQEHATIGLYTGTNTSTDLVINSGIQTDFVVVKTRDSVGNNAVADVLRGNSKILITSSSGAEADYSGTSNSINSIGDATSFTVRDNGVGGYGVNSADNFWYWVMKAAGAGVSNSDGSITSTVSANTNAGFSICTYTGTGVNATIGHGLLQPPDLIIVRKRDSIESWSVYHSANTSAPETDYLKLNATDTTSDLNTQWNDTAPTSSVFSIGIDNAVNASNGAYVAYCFEFGDVFTGGSYTGNGNADGVFIPTDELLYFLTKRTDVANSWTMYDQLRKTINPNGNYLLAESNAAEVNSTTLEMDFLSNGMKARDNQNNINASGGTYIWWGIKKNGGQLSC